jgi:hypothetical protein
MQQMQQIRLHALQHILKKEFSTVSKECCLHQQNSAHYKFVVETTKSKVDAKKVWLV